MTVNGQVTPPHLSFDKRADSIAAKEFGRAPMRLKKRIMLFLGAIFFAAVMQSLQLSAGKTPAREEEL